MRTNLNKRDEVVINLLLDNYEIEVCEPAEPGYSLSDNEKAALICYNWSRLAEKYPNIYEHLDSNFLLLYSDEWIILEDGCYRIIPDSYGWQPSIVIDCDQYITVNELNDYSDSEFIDFLDRNDYLNNFKKAINLWNFEPRGVHVEEEEFYMFENHREPEKILSELLKSDPNGKYYFVIDGVSQFGLDFSIYKI